MNRKKLLISGIVMSIALANWTNCRAQGVSVSAAPPAKDADKPALRLENNILRLNAGAILLNPYQLGDVRTNAAGNRVRDLSDGDTEGKFFIDVGANWVWAWNVDRRHDWMRGRTGHKHEQWIFCGGEWLQPDFQGRLSFVAKDDKETTTSAIIGSGEFGLEFTLGMPIYRSIWTEEIENDFDEEAIYKATRSAHWVGVILASGGTTDASSFDIHRRDFFGFGYRAAYKQLWSKDDVTPREVALAFQVGYARVDSVQFVDRGNDRSILLRNGEAADYDMKNALAFEAEVYIPISSSLNVVFGTRLYSGLDPNTWNAYVAATFSLEKLAKMFE